MGTRGILLIIVLGILVGLVFGALMGASLVQPQVVVSGSGVQLGAPEQDDFIITVAEAYSSDRDLRLAQDRLSRLHDPKIAIRVQTLALNYAPQRDLAASYLALLAVALGSQNPTLVELSATATPTATNTATFTPTFTPTHTPTFTPTFLPTPTPFDTSTPTPRPPTRVPPTATWTPKPPPPVSFFPDRSRWPGSFNFVPANVAPGQGYWHLTKAIYCDAFDGSDPHRSDFGCDEMPGGPVGTSIYVMTGGAAIDAIKPDGTNVGGDRNIIGDKKAPDDMCNCTYTFESANYRISVAGAPSDAVSGFCLCSVNFGWGSHAHVRYFLYFEYITR